MLDMYGCELNIGDVVKVFGIYENIKTLNWGVCNYQGYEIIGGNNYATVSNYDKKFSSQEIVLLSSK